MGTAQFPARALRSNPSIARAPAPRRQAALEGLARWTEHHPAEGCASALAQGAQVGV